MRTFGVLKVEELEGAGLLERTLEIPERTVDLYNGASLAESLGTVHREQRTLAMTVFSARLLLIPIATCIGLVSQLVPSLTDPSLSVIAIASLGIAAQTHPPKKMSSSSSLPAATPTDQRYARPTPS